MSFGRNLPVFGLISPEMFVHVKQLLYLCKRKRVKTKMNGDQTERLSQEGECRNESECGILEAASEVARRVLEEIEALAGTTACKSV